MIKLTINNSTSRIEGLSSQQNSELKEILSYQVSAQEAFFTTGYRSKRYLIDRRGSFPTGLLYLVDDYFAKKGILHTIDRKDLRKRPEPRQGLFSLSLAHTPYPEQIEASEACKTHRRGIVVAPTGVGKSVIAALIIHALQVPTLIVVPKLELKRQLLEVLRACFGYAKVGGIGHHVAVENVDALDPKQALEGYDCVIIDEFHHAGAKTYRKLNQKSWNKVFYRFGLTATPFRSKSEERLLLESVLSQVIYSIPYQTAVEREYIVPVEAYYYDLPKMEVDGYTWAQVYNELVVNRRDRNALIANLIKNLHLAKAPTLTLVKEIKHGQILSDLTGAGFANGQSEDCQALIAWFNHKRIASLIGTTGVLGEGIDTRPAEYIIIAGLGKSKNAFMQQAGRGVRRYGYKSSAKIILFRDPSHKWTLAHFKEQCKILREEYDIKPVKLNRL